MSDSSHLELSNPYDISASEQISRVMATFESASSSIVYLPFKGDMQVLSASHVHFKQTYHEVKFLREGDSGMTYATIPKRKANDILARHSQQKTPALYDELRSSLVAAKFNKDNKLEGDLSAEIYFLTQFFTPVHPGLTGAIDSHLQDKIQWVTLPFCSGGNLVQFSNQFPEALTLPFR